MQLRPGASALSRGTGLVIGAAVVCLVIFACWSVGGWGSPTAVTVARAVGCLASSTFAVTCAAAAAIEFADRRRLAWVITAIGLGGWVVGDLIWAWYAIVLHADPPLPSIADAAYLLLPVAVCVSWVVNASAESPLMGLRPLLDGVIMAAALGIVAWVFVLRKAFSDGHLSPLAMAITMAYPVADIVVVTMAVVVVSTLPPAHRLSAGLFAAGLVAIAVSDSLRLQLGLRGDLFLGWPTGMVLIGVAALTAMSVPRLQYRRTEPVRVLYWLPYVPMPIALAIAVRQLWSGPADHYILLSGVVMMGAGLIRQFLVLVDNHVLLGTVAAQALRDDLTGLANRQSFADRLRHAMVGREGDGRQVAVLSLDLDDFKLVNDNLGHPQGDALLSLVADRLRVVLPAGDTLARLGGDEFAVLMEGGAPPMDVAQRIIEVFDKPFYLDGDEVYIHPSAGLAAAGRGDGDGVSADELVKRADLAMYTAKRAGVGGVQCYTSDMRHVDSAELRTSLSESGRRRRTPLAHIALLGQLRRAIDDDGLCLVYQPKVSLSTGCLVGVEALVRWQHPEMGLLTPNQFLPLVRQNGLMGAVTELVVNRAVRDATSWYHADDCAVPVAINLFASSLNDMSLPDDIAAALTRVGLPPTALSAEITEHLLLANVRRASVVIERLRAIGLSIAIDDFGSGYSTMSYLRDLHVDEVKLDRQFIAPVLHNERAAAIVRSVIDLAHTLGIVCIAEGVEDQATADRLRDYGCDIAQGHYFAHPLSVEALLQRCDSGAGCASTPWPRHELGVRHAGFDADAS